MSETVAAIVCCVRLYLRFLFHKRQITQDVSDSLPGVCFPERATIPSVWDKELLAQLLDRIDRHSPRGKRDYAIVLLACRLGVRSSDIRALTLDHIDWEDRQDLLGHKSGRITTHYSAAEWENLIEAANRVCGETSRKSPALVLLKQKAVMPETITA